MFDFSAFTTWLHQSLLGFMPEWLAVTAECVLVGFALLLAYSVLALFYIWYERKICAFIQCRLGPNRVGPFGLLQSVADMFKILIKELISLNHVDKFLFALAPYLVILASMLAFAVLPWGNGLQIIDFNIGIFFLIAVSSIGVLGILLAGWSSANKFTLIGALRSGAQMISYELSIGLSVLTMVCFAGTMSVGGIVEAQSDLWFIVKGHIPAIIAFIIYLIAGTAETNRGPFDLPVADGELTARYKTADTC
ncbi:MAG: NADH-quinone oxidoreductase subunit H, partial [Paramuribaculum sp.]|nr:NADH-quinone oxidoreductase subunit H [Paramuribaculum sp.]